MKKNGRLFVSVFLLLAITGIGGCSSAYWANSIRTWGANHHVKQFSGGVLIGEWISTGKVENEANSDGYYFEDELSRQVRRISGDVQITPANPAHLEKIRARLKIEQAAKDAADTAVPAAVDKPSAQ